MANVEIHDRVNRLFTVHARVGYLFIEIPIGVAYVSRSLDRQDAEVMLCLMRQAFPGLGDDNA